MRFERHHPKMDHHHHLPSSSSSSSSSGIGIGSGGGGSSALSLGKVASHAPGGERFNVRRLLPLIFVAVILLSLLLVALAPSPAAPSLPDEVAIAAGLRAPYPALVMFGDSLTSMSARLPFGGFALKLLEACERKCDVILRGFGGYNTTSAKILLPILFPPGAGKNIFLMTVWFGANDAAVNDQQVPLRRYEENLIDILDHLIEKFRVPDRNLLLICPPPVGPQAKNRTFERTESYSKACLKVGKVMKLRTLDTYELFRPHDLTDLFLPDHIHLSNLANDLVASEILPLVTSLPIKFPTFLEILARGHFPEEAL